MVRAGNSLDATPTYALLPQLETGKINCVRPRCYGRLPPGAREKTQLSGRSSLRSVPSGYQFPTLEAHLRESLPIFAGSHPRMTLKQIPEEPDILISDF